MAFETDHLGSYGVAKRCRRLGPGSLPPVSVRRRCAGMALGALDQETDRVDVESGFGSAECVGSCSAAAIASAIRPAAISALTEQ